MKTRWPRTVGSLREGRWRAAIRVACSTREARWLARSEGASGWRRPHPLSSLPSSVGVPQLTWMQSSVAALTEVFLTAALMPSEMPWCARVMTAWLMSVPRPPRTRMPYQAPLPPSEVSSTGLSAVPRTHSVPSMISSTRCGSTPDLIASRGAAMTRTPGSRVSFVPQATVTSPWST